MGSGEREPRSSGVLFAAALTAVAVGALHAVSRDPGREDPRAAPRPAEPPVSAAAFAADAADPRGRGAAGPHQIPARGWMDVLWRTYAEVNDDRVLSVGAGVAYYGLLALFPFLSAFVSVYGLVADPTTVEQHLAMLRGLLPASALDLVGTEMHRLAAQPEGALGFGFLVSLALALWSANAGMKAMFDALNVAYGETEKRGFIRLTAVTLAFTLGAVVFLGVVIAAVVALPVVLDRLGLGAFAEGVIRFARWPMVLLTVAFGIAVLDRYGPSRARARWRWVTPGSALSAVLFVIVSLGFSWYAENFGSYDQTYGSIGAVAVFMVWLWIAAVVVLLGAELNAEVEHQTARDSTTGPELPMGRRGAEMADTVGAAQG